MPMPPDFPAALLFECWSPAWLFVRQGLCVAQYWQPARSTACCQKLGEMMDLTRAELDFLASQGLAEADVLDGRRMSQEQGRRAAKELNKPVVLGSPCKKAGHRLRTRPGHCAQCDPKKLGYQKRHLEPKDLYIAFSRRAGLVKVGSSNSVDVRINKINFEGVGGATDWRLIFRVPVKEGQRLETEVQALLSEHMSPSSYIKDGRRQESRECFKCSAAEALEAVLHAAQRGEHDLGTPWRSPAWPS